MNKEFPIRIGFCAPSRALRDPSSLDEMSSYFQERGAEVLIDEAARRNIKQFAGTDEERAKSLVNMAALGADLIMPIRGGYGLSRILDAIDYQALSESGAVFCGYSDFTAFNLAYFKRTGKVSFQGPAGTDFIDNPVYSTLQSFKNALFSKEWVLSFTSKTLIKLDFEGTLWGGNLSLITSLVGSSFMPDVENGILFLEDGNERAYRIERMLLQLFRAGILQKQKAVLLGDFRDADPMHPKENDFLFSDALSYLRSLLPSVAFIDGLPFGHEANRCTLPVGAVTRLKADKGYVVLSTMDKPVVRQSLAQV